MNYSPCGAPKTTCGSDRTAHRGCTCLDYAIGFLALLLALAVGLILGSVFTATIQPAIAAFIAFAAAIAAIFIALLIYRCRRGC